jgi:hypothetical protein
LGVDEFAEEEEGSTGDGFNSDVVFFSIGFGYGGHDCKDWVFGGICGDLGTVAGDVDDAYITRTDLVD